MFIPLGRIYRSRSGWSATELRNWQRFGNPVVLSDVDLFSLSLFSNSTFKTLMGQPDLVVKRSGSCSTGLLGCCNYSHLVDQTRKSHSPNASWWHLCPDTWKAYLITGERALVTSKITPLERHPQDSEKGRENPEKVQDFG